MTGIHEIPGRDASRDELRDYAQWWTETDGERKRLEKQLIPKDDLPNEILKLVEKYRTKNVEEKDQPSPIPPKHMEPIHVNVSAPAPEKTKTSPPPTPMADLEKYNRLLDLYFLTARNRDPLSTVSPWAAKPSSRFIFEWCCRQLLADWKTFPIFELKFCPYCGSEISVRISVAGKRLE